MWLCQVACTRMPSYHILKDKKLHHWTPNKSLWVKVAFGSFCGSFMCNLKLRGRNSKTNDRFSQIAFEILKKRFLTFTFILREKYLQNHLTQFLFCLVVSNFLKHPHRDKNLTHRIEKFLKKQSLQSSTSHRCGQHKTLPRGWEARETKMKRNLNSHCPDDT